jgi:hypothetical protein
VGLLLMPETKDADLAAAPAGGTAPAVTPDESSTQAPTFR